MEKHLLFKFIILISVLSIISCGRLREIDQIDSAEIFIDFELDVSLRKYSGNMEFSNINTSSAPLNSMGFFLLPNEVGGSLTIESVLTGDRTTEYSVEDSVLTVKFSEAIVSGDSYTVKITYSGTVPSTLFSPGIFVRTEDTVALGSFYPLPIPLNDKGAFDVVIPSDHGDPVESILSRFSVTFRAPEDLQFAASGIVNYEGRSGDKKHYSVKTGPVRDFYLLGSENWDKVSKVYNGIRINSWYPKGRMQQGIDSLYYIENSFQIFEEHLGAYPYNSMNIVSAPLGPHVGGMEYPGIIVLNDTFYIEEDSFGLQWVIAHEIGHQWFYNLVGNDPVMEPWLDESFTQYATWLYFEKLYGRLAGNRIFSSFNNRWQRIRKEAIPLNLSAHEYHGREYGAIPYGKGPLFLFTVQTKFGDELFDQFILDYIAEYRWKRVTTEKLREFMFRYFGEEGDLLFREWVYSEEI
jgi:Peptidase family M1 domain